MLIYSLGSFYLFILSCISLMLIFVFPFSFFPPLYCSGWLFFANQSFSSIIFLSAMSSLLLYLFTSSQLLHFSDLYFHLIFYKFHLSAKILHLSIIFMNSLIKVIWSVCLKTPISWTFVSLSLSRILSYFGHLVLCPGIPLHLLLQADHCIWKILGIILDSLLLLLTHRIGTDRLNLVREWSD